MIGEIQIAICTFVRLRRPEIIGRYKARIAVSFDWWGGREIIIRNRGRIIDPDRSVHTRAHIGAVWATGMNAGIIIMSVGALL